jgi:tetratricopeptide (TPR) repeat protein
MIQLADAHGGAGQFIEADAAFARASELMTSLGYGETQKAVKLYNDWALTLTYAGRELQAEKIYRRAIDISRTNETDEAVQPILLHNYAGVLRELGRDHEATAYADLALSKAQRTGNKVLLDQTDMQRVRIYRDEQDLSRADSLLADLETRMRRQMPSDHYAIALLTSEKSLLAEAKGDLPNALQLADQALAIDEAAIRVQGGCEALLPVMLVRRSEIEVQVDKREQAEADAKQALNLLRSSMQTGVRSSNLGRAYLALGRALQSQGKTSEARSAFHAAEENLRETLGAEHPDTRSARLLAASEPQRG